MIQTQIAPCKKGSDANLQLFLGIKIKPRKYTVATKQDHFGIVGHLLKISWCQFYLISSSISSLYLYCFLLPAEER